MGSRSRHGCWTCRLRRKKCDEGRPLCSSCLSLELVCYRDGAKPHWMDSGAQEKVKLAEVKRTVKGALAKRRSHLNNSQTVATSDHDRSVISAGATSPICVLPIPSVTMNTDLYELNSYEAPGSQQSDQDQFERELDLSAYLDYDHLIQQAFMGGISGETSSTGNTTFPGGAQIEERVVLWPASTNSFTQEAMANVEEATLLMCYLDHVFYIQFPCFDAFPSSGIRGWLFCHLRRTPWLYDSTIALAKTYQMSLSQASTDNLLDLDPADDMDQCYCLALQGLQLALKESHTWIGRTGQTNALQAFMCICQLMYFEIFKGCSGDWTIHLRTAASLVPFLIQEFSISMELDSVSCEFGGTLETIIEGSEAILQLDHEALLHNDQIRATVLMGCDNWVLLQLFKISRLHKWRKREESHDRLSFAELAKKGAHIEELVKSHILQLPNGDSEESSGQRRPFYPQTVTSMEITRIYALATLTYLHVVVSGANPKLPEIIQSVSNTLAALADLIDKRTLRILVWPLCITGCLVSEEQQSEFSNLIHSADLSEREVGTLSQAFKIVKECWRLRKNGSRNCDWTFAMNSLDCRILLV